MDESLTEIRHERSKKDFPKVDFEDGEYIEFVFSRAKVCLLMIWGGVVIGLILVLFGFLLALMGQEMIDEMGMKFLFIILFALLAAAIIAGLLATKIYQGNKLIVTNIHVIQMVMNTPVSTSINIIDLPSIEDASFRQDSLLEKLFHYGTFRLSTVGDETTYTFKYSDISPRDLKEVTKLITEAKKKVKKTADA
ncbi:hypothetical protein J6S37_02855 [Candidatus Saccharibacteria bacterium]|nr:hypothetical protein [Candidatus Saccharibacteria bacterium]